MGQKPIDGSCRILDAEPSEAEPQLRRPAGNSLFFIELKIRWKSKNIRKFSINYIALSGRACYNEDVLKVD